MKGERILLFILGVKIPVTSSRKPSFIVCLAGRLSFVSNFGLEMRIVFSLILLATLVYVVSGFLGGKCEYKCPPGFNLLLRTQNHKYSN